MKKKKYQKPELELIKIEAYMFNIDGDEAEAF